MEKRLAKVSGQHGRRSAVFPPATKLSSRVTFREETETANDISLAVGRQGRERVGLEHASDNPEFPLSLGVGLAVHPCLAGSEGEVRLKG